MSSWFVSSGPGRHVHPCPDEIYDRPAPWAIRGVSREPFANGKHLNLLATGTFVGIEFKRELFEKYAYDFIQYQVQNPGWFFVKISILDPVQRAEQHQLLLDKGRIGEAIHVLCAAIVFLEIDSDTDSEGLWYGHLTPDYFGLEYAPIYKIYQI
jgi:hypothetical protein